MLPGHAAMKISVLLPTRNRLDYLKLAIETVRRQQAENWEIVISDNDSEEDIEGYVASLADERILYSRTSGFLPVTDNWNAALALSSGDYVVMMGDDDALLPGYLESMCELVERFDRPDLIYVGSLLFTYPGVDPQHGDGFLTVNSYAEFLAGQTTPFVLAHERAVESVRRSMDFRHSFNFNMQLSLVSRRLIDSLQPNGSFFQSPFPDFYATCVAMLRAGRVVVEPQPQVVIGVTPKSYGFFHLNEREREGREFLDTAATSSAQLPGTNINEGWLRAMERVEDNYGAEFALHVSRRRYRMLQAGHVYTRRFRGAGDDAELADLNASLPRIERWLFGCAYAAAAILARVLPKSLWNTISRRLLGQYPVWEPPREEGRYADILEVFERHRGERRDTPLTR
jgi:hypothetical protein